MVAALLNRNPKGVVLFGEDGVDVGTAVALVESNSKHKVLDKWSLNGFAGSNLNRDKVTLGIGIEKHVVDIKDAVRIGVGVYATKDARDFLYLQGLKKLPNVKLGISGTWRF